MRGTSNAYCETWIAVKVLIESRSVENCSSRNLVCAIVWLNSVSDRASCAEWRSLACDAMIPGGWMIVMLSRENFGHGQRGRNDAICLEVLHGPHFLAVDTNRNVRDSHFALAMYSVCRLLWITRLIYNARNGKDQRNQCET
jgi:hypothetical protein